ncbi:hypothetical protein [Pedobacter roseus]|uniref:Uncharacterized protein n=1 Tax=Pedobacter roseus TaxID=336820 RepID=A0A7G9QJB0_9SPHI|nr:hypothetical protein [Pedobacter roseus]QNN43435.1 hypothetical protein H9L23_04860 [Pedobacter roseus]
MATYITIISTVLENASDKSLVALAIAGFDGVSEWSIDLEDIDKVIRIVSVRDISSECCEKLALFGIKATVMQVFDDRYHLM